MAGRSFPTPSALLLGFTLVFSAPASAQPIAGRSPEAAVAAPENTLSGRVLDPARAAVPNARIAAVPDGGPPGFTALSGPDGGFSMVLPAGRYTVRVAADGFLEASRLIDFPRHEAGMQDFVLRIGTRNDTITVTDRAVYGVSAVGSATRTLTPLRDLPQSVTIVTRELIRDQLMTGIGDVVRYVPGVTAHQGENNRDQIVMRGNSSSADFFVNGVRDDAQYYRDLYNLERVEALKGPNAMTFGRGGAGGVINRVTKEAGFAPLREMSLQGGAYGNQRFSTDLDHAIGEKLALRLNGMYENSDSFRNFVGLRRLGLNPTATILAGRRTRVTLGYEFLRDDRVADRGIPSFHGKPADIPISTFFGNPDESRVRARVHLGSAAVEHQAGALTIRNRTLVADYDRGYQNFVPGTVSQDMARVAVSAYNNASRRRNGFSQTDLTYPLATGRIRHMLLAGVEAGRQLTDNSRNTGYFNGSAASVAVPLADPLIRTPVWFRQSATDADNHIRAGIAAAYAQDQLKLSRSIQLVAGIRFDYFDLRYHNNRNRENLRRIDRLVSPRAGLVYRPVAPLSIYGNYSVSYLPGSGDQFSSLTAVTQQMKPEKFSNYEIGAKWDISRYLSLTTAVYRLDRTNTRAIDPSNPTRIVQTGSQRSNGYEAGFNGSLTRAWNIAGGLAYQDAYFVNATAAAHAGARAAQVPHLTFSVWNSYQILPRVGCGLGILNRGDMFAAVDNTVTLPGYTRADAAVFFSLSERMRLQVNVENLFDARYYVNADGNNNISPGFPRSVRIALLTRF